MINYAVIGVTPDVVNYAKAIRRDLLTPEERKRYYAKFETRALLQSAFKDQITSFQIGVNTEIYSPNEVREFMDMNPYEGGDEYRTRTSTVKDSKGENGNEPKVQK
jgi:phage portal protein BeeE